MQQKEELKVQNIKILPTVNTATNAVLFSEISLFYSEEKRKGKPVLAYHSIQSLAEKLNNLPQKLDKQKAPAILKGRFEGGTAGKYCVNPAGYLFFDIDAKDNKAWAYDKATNAHVFEILQKYSLLTWRSYSGNGIAGLIECNAIESFTNETSNFHNQLAQKVYEHLAKIILASTGQKINFDPAQGKFRQVRFLAPQKVKVKVNQNAFCFDVDFEIVKATYSNGLPRYNFTGSVIGSIQDQFNQSNKIEDILLNFGYTFLSNGRVKSPSTSALTSGEIKDGILFNYSSSSGLKRGYNPFNFILEHKYNDDFKAFISDLKQQGYKNIEPEQKSFIKDLKAAKTDEVISNLCYQNKYLSFDKKIEVVNQQAENKKEKVRTFLGLKDLGITYDLNYKSAGYVDEVILKVFNDLDQHSNIVLQAETGTGKTTAILKDFNFIRPGKRLLLCVPLVSIANQLANTYKDVTALTEASSIETHSQARRSPIVVATYENAGRHLKEKNEFDYIVIDETHQMINANSYKAATVSKLAILIKDKKVLGLTGTPNQLFKKLGFKLAKVHTPSKPTTITQRVLKEAPEKVIISHIKNSKRKLIVRLNSKDTLSYIKDYLVDNEILKETEILLLYSDNEIKQSEHFKRLTNKEKFEDQIKVVLTTSVIDEGINIKQIGFDTLFLENTYFYSPESIKQFTARFRNEDPDRKHFYYVKLTKDQSIKNITLDKAFEYYNLNSLEDFASYKDALNQNIKYLEDYSQSIFYQGYESLNLFLNKLNRKEYNQYLTENYNLNIEVDEDFQIELNELNAIKEAKLKDKSLIFTIWKNYKPDVFKVLNEIQGSKNHHLANPLPFDNDSLFDNSNEFKSYVIFHKSKFQQLDYYYYELSKYFKNPDSFMINDDKIAYSTKLKNELQYHETKALLKNPKTMTDRKHKKQIEAFYLVLKLKRSFSPNDIEKAWRRETKSKINKTLVMSLIQDRFDLWKKQGVFHIKKTAKNQQAKCINNPPIFIIHRKLTQTTNANNAKKKCNTCKTFYKNIFSYKRLMQA
jgi:hypothetical protein